jgi:hypothetical protein
MAPMAISPIVTSKVPGRKLFIFIKNFRCFLGTCHPDAILVVLCEEQDFSLTGSIFGHYGLVLNQKNIYSR